MHTLGAHDGRAEAPLTWRAMMLFSLEEQTLPALGMVEID